ncbi:MAG: ABC transporter substrate-binding protein [Burkholderiales bacterium]
MLSRSAVPILLALLLLVTCSFGPAWAQQPAKIPVAAVLVTHAAAKDPVFDMLRTGLRQFGWDDGRNIKVEIATAEGKLDRLPSIAADLVSRKVDVILCPNELSTRTAMRATSTIPIVMVGFAGYDPVALGIVKSLNRPDGNVTGQYGYDSALEGKRLQLLKDTLPRVSRVAVHWEAPYGSGGLEEIQRAAKALGVQLELIEIKGASDLERGFKAAKDKKAGAIIQIWSPTFYVNRDTIAALALKLRLPVMGSLDSSLTGELMSYGTDMVGMWQRTAYFVDRILKGTKTTELPVEQVMRLKLVVNMKTAKILGITFPESVLVWADEVIR